MTDVKISRNSLAYKEFGYGPTVVILHGLFGSADNLANLAKDLAADHRVICIDLPGHGQSARLNDYAHDSMARAIQNTLESLSLTNFQLLGHSLGGKIGMQLASRLNSRVVAHQPSALKVEKLIVVDIAPRDYPPHHDDVFKALNTVPTQLPMGRREADALMAKHIAEPGVRAFLLKSFRSNNSNKQHNPVYWEFDVNGLQSQYAKLAVSPQLPNTIECPTLFIKGALSEYLLPIDEARIKEAFKAPEFKIIEGAGHWPHAEKPAAFNRIVRRFITRVT